MNLHSAQTLAIDLMSKHDLISKGWRFTFDTAVRRFGCCKYYSKTITLSKALTELNSESEVKNTILHEIAHALTPGQKHNHVWRRKAIEIGCTGDRCYKSDEVEKPESKYVAFCIGCGKKHRKHRMTNSISSCGFCSGGKYNPNFKLDFQINPNY
jgi:predicted SprT family Zn-dependent metalloprotease